MKILFYRLMDNNVYSIPSMVSDYQSDCVLHGLRLEFGNDIHEYQPSWWMLKSYKEKNPEAFTKIWGKGFTIYGLLPDYDFPSNEIILNNLSNKKYDKIILGIHHTNCQNYNHILEIINQFINFGYERKQILIIDGWDREPICLQALNLGIYFKREHNGKHEAYPLSFAIPEEKIVDDTPYYKTMAFSPMIPAMFSWGDCEHVSSYKYLDENEYNKQYQQSYFAYTCKKGGWDCLRHYEILANGCIPWFTDIEKCPQTILVTFPKEICIEAKKIKGLKPGTTIEYNSNIDTYLGDTRLIKPNEERGYITKDFDYMMYDKLRIELLNYTRKNLTTRALAKYILNV